LGMVVRGVAFKGRCKPDHHVCDDAPRIRERRRLALTTAGRPVDAG
jgi:hypothetical protein